MPPHDKTCPLTATEALLEENRALLAQLGVANKKTKDLTQQLAVENSAVELLREKNLILTETLRDFKDRYNFLAAKEKWLPTERATSSRSVAPKPVVVVDQKLLAENKSLKQQIEGMRRSLNSLRSENKKMQHQHESLSLEIEDLNDEKDRFLRSIARLKREVRRSRSQIHDLESINDSNVESKRRDGRQSPAHRALVTLSFGGAPSPGLFFDDHSRTQQTSTHFVFHSAPHSVQSSFTRSATAGHGVSQSSTSFMDSFCSLDSDDDELLSF